MANPRIAKLEDQIQRIIAEMLGRRVKDPRLGFVTITDVRLTGDGREATVFYTDLGRSLDGREADAAGGVSDTATALESAKGLLRTTIGQQLGLKFTPTLTFVPDASEKTAQEMEDLLARVQAADAELAKEREGSAFAGEADPYKKPVEPADE
ncbi:Ribosome-binding factor A [bioreactor metagenome]|jgi:ribosome-binding factor A|uniref:Ribosome-binding factor A n=2 Tax=root TaxID=1 RepID=A0AAN0K8L1_9ACTN|nr:30S ribosome-binding factor RbfA [Brooklawnia sp. SH051]MCB0883665.1 30S ribosome-binding factor RbfA [Propionibacteriaceae bacterium]MEA5120079.1 30S ribosome-binding factor RbfA [Propionibacterium sp.]NLI83911.1 30S ribosome-binding factor RbfA [Propionibacterium sp.]BEH01147.1 30S ribosome-binding factor RbfA [Brooklawnia sp. SH051]